MFSCLQILEAFLWFVLITLLNVTLIILTLSVSRLLNLLLRLVAFLLFLNPQCLASISRWITASSSWKRFCLFVCRALSSIMVICMLTAIRLLLTFVMSLYLLLDRKSGSAGMPRPISYAVFCLKKKNSRIATGSRRTVRGSQLACPVCVFFFNDPATPEIYTLSLHDAFRSSWKRFCLFVCRALSSIMVICMLTAIRLLLTFVMSLYLLLRS